MKWVTSLRFEMVWDSIDHLEDLYRLEALILLIHWGMTGSDNCLICCLSCVGE